MPRCLLGPGGQILTSATGWGKRKGPFLLISHFGVSELGGGLGEELKALGCLSRLALRGH